MFPSYSGGSKFPSTKSYSSTRSSQAKINFSLLHEMQQGDILVSNSIKSSVTNPNSTNSSVDGDHAFPRRRSSSTSRLSTSSSSRNGIGNRGNGMNRGSIRKSKMSSEKVCDSASSAKQNFSSSPESIDRIISDSTSASNCPDLQHLPVEIHAKILHLLDPLDVLAYSSTCKRFEKYGDCQKVWYVKFQFELLDSLIAIEFVLY